MLLLSLFLFVALTASSLGTLVDIQDVTERSVNEQYPDMIDLQLNYGNGENEIINVKRNPLHNNNVAVESIDSNGVKRSLDGNLDVAEYISKRAALHVTSEFDGQRYRRSVSGLIYRRDTAYLVRPDERAKRMSGVTSYTADKVDFPMPTADRPDMEGLVLHDELEPPYEEPASYSRRRFPKGTRLIVDVLSIIDYSLYKMLKDQYVAKGGRNDRDQILNYIKRYYGVIWAGIIQRYEGVRHRGMTVTPRLAKIIVATSPSEDHWTYNRRDGDSVEGNPALQDLADWMNMKKRDGEYQDIDHTMLFTGLRMYSWQDERGGGKKKSFAVVGLAYTGAICGRWSVSMIEEDLRLRSVGTSAHELGHSLGSRHDGPPNKPSCPSDDHHLMCPYVTNGNENTYPNIYHFSRCSMDSFHEVMERLNGESGNCMADNPSHDGEMRVLTDGIPGIRIDLHAQCKAYLGDENSYYCGPNTERYMRSNACHRFECWQHGRCQSYFRHHALHGTPCGRTMWCENARCVRADDGWDAIINDQYGSCPVRDADECWRKPSSICSDPKEAEKCCNKCKK